VLHGSGPAVVFAGAGSGKTRVITTRIAHLIDQGVSPWSILAVTFTNKAASEMRSRIFDLRAGAHGCTVATFHSACARWLREFADELGFSSDFTIYDDSDSVSALKVVVAGMGPNVDLGAIVPEMKAFIHLAKTNAWFPNDVAKMSDQLGNLIPAGGVAIYKRYQEYLAHSNAMDFGDLLLNMLLLLRRNQTVREIMQRRYKYVLVDEYQDTNQTQMELIQLIVGPAANLFVVGDDDQSIYSWRGASPSNIIEFERFYPDAKRYILGENYRSTATIVNAAGAMIANNQNRAAKEIYTANDDGELIDFHLETDNEMEAWWVVENIVNEQDKFSFDDVAIFYRTNSQSRALEDELRRRNVSYQVFGTVRFYDRLEVKDIVAYMRLMVNPQDNVSCRRVINVPARGIGAKALEDVEAFANKNEVSLLEACEKLVSQQVPKLAKKVFPFVKVITELRKRIEDVELYDVVGNIVQACGYAEHLKKKFPEHHLDKLENVHELSSAMEIFLQKSPKATLADWLQSVTLEREVEGESQVGGVSLMTLHLAKGLEFARAYLVGVEEGLLPHRNSLDDLRQLEEERRLFYVGMTRAREKLSLVCAYRRRNYNQTMMNPPSRFIGEIPGQYLEGHGASELDQNQDDPYAQTTYDYDGGEFSGQVQQVSVGQRIFHPTYGRGEVTEIEAFATGTKVIVDFEEFGFRKVSLSQLSP